MEYIAPSSRSALDGESLQLSAPHGVSSSQDELGLPTTAGMLAPALTAGQQEEGRLWAAQDENDDYEDAMFDDHGGPRPRRRLLKSLPSLMELAWSSALCHSGRPQAQAGLGRSVGPTSLWTQPWQAGDPKMGGGA